MNRVTDRLSFPSYLLSILIKIRKNITLVTCHKVRVDGRSDTNQEYFVIR